MNKAITRLREVIKAVDEDRLHMTTWSEKAECGTAYCAAGWARLDPQLQQTTTINQIFAISADGLVYSTCNDPFRALAEAFDISKTDSENLFGGELHWDLPPHCVSKREVLDNIDRILAGIPTEPYEAILENES